MNQWTIPLEWNGGMEYWNSFFIYDIQEGRDQRSCWTSTVKKEVVCVYF